jgi:heat shock protein HtpX
LPDFYDKEHVVTREQCPTLFKRVDEVARSLNTSGADIIVVDDRFNASITELGRHRKKVLYLGLPLLSILDARETTALLAHELGHCVNGDPKRGHYIGTALYSLIRWHTLFLPSESGFSRIGFGCALLVVPAIVVVLILIAATQVWIQQLVFVIAFSMPFVIYMLSVSFLARLWLSALAHLLWREMQRAEYLADALAAQVSGTAAMLSILEKMHLAGAFYAVVHRMVLNSTGRNLFDEVRTHIQHIPLRELERIRRVERLHDSRLDATHPPTFYRIELLEAHEVNTPRLAVELEEFEQMRRELAALEQPIQQEILDMENRYLYA